MVENLEHPLGPIPWQRVVQRGCEVQHHHRRRKDAHAQNSRYAATLKCGKHENWGSSHCRQQADTMADAVRDFFPERLRAFSPCGRFDHDPISCAAHLQLGRITNVANTTILISPMGSLLNASALGFPVGPMM